MIRVADYIANFIYEQGVRDVFMLSGGGSIYLDDGIACHGKLNHISARNEATAPMMAEAYARITGNLGVVYVTTGPGGANAISGLAEAWVDSAPILIISGQVESKYASHNICEYKLRTFGTQELDIIKIVRPITKYAEMVNDPNGIRYHLEKAVHRARWGRPGPVWLDIPLDIQNAMVDENKLIGYTPIEVIYFPSIQDLDKLIDLLKQSKKPLIIAGQGIRITKSVNIFKNLVEKLKIPIVFSRLGQDILPFSHKYNFGHAGTKGCLCSNLIIQESDLIISIGSRLSVPFIEKNKDVFNGKSKLVVVDIDDSELSKNSIKIDLSIKSDVKEFITDFHCNVIHDGLPNYSEWMNRCQSIKKDNPIITNELKRNPIDLYYFVSRLDKLANENHIFVSDAGSSYYVTGQVLTFEKNQREITSGAFASMGVAVPLAIGCAIAKKDKQILVITGDGSIELNIQELKTMSFYKMNIKLFIINNGGYVSIRNTQDTLCGGRYINSNQASCDEILDFKKVADAFNLPYEIIQTYEEIDSKLMNIMNTIGPILVEVICDNKQKIIS